MVLHTSIGGNVPDVFTWWRLRSHDRIPVHRGQLCRPI